MRYFFDGPSTAENTFVYVDELTLIEGCRAGTAAAWERFAVRYRDRLYAAAIQLTRDQAAAHDLVDSLWGELYLTRASPAGKLASYTGRGSLEGWLKAILVRAFIDRYRSQKRARTVGLDDQILVIGQVCAPVTHYVDSRLGDAIRESFTALPAESRYLLASYYFDQRTFGEIALTLGVHESTVCRRMKRLIRKLRQQIRRRMRLKGIDESELNQVLNTDLDELSLNLRRHFFPGAEFAGE